MTTRDNIIQELIEHEWTGFLADLIPAVSIDTDKAIEHYRKLGYTQVMGIEDLGKIVGAGVNLSHIYYDKNGISPRTVYFDEENDIIMNLILGKDIDGNAHILYASNTLKEDIDKYTNWMRELLKDKDYSRFIIATPRAYREQILVRLNKKDSDVTYEKYQGAIHFD